MTAPPGAARRKHGGSVPSGHPVPSDRPVPATGPGTGAGPTPVEDVLVVGEAVLDVVADDAGRCDAHPGGSPANVALGLGRLRRPVRLWTRLAEDDAGRSITAHLAAAGVRVRAVPPAPPATPTAVARLDATGAAEYTFTLDGELDPLPDPDPWPAHLHTGSLGALLAPGADQVHHLVARAAGRCTVSFDPNVRPDLLPVGPALTERVEALAARCDLVKASDEDLAHLYPDLTWLQGATRWLRAGARCVVVTRGADGLSALTGTGRVDRPAVRVPVVDTVGAGDTVMAALIDGLLTLGLLGPVPGRSACAGGGPSGGADRSTGPGAGPITDPGPTSAIGAGRDRVASTGASWGPAAGLGSATADRLAPVLDRCARAAALTVSRAGADLPDREELDAHPSTAEGSRR